MFFYMIQIHASAASATAQDIDENQQLEQFAEELTKTRMLDGYEKPKVILALRKIPQEERGEIVDFVKELNPRDHVDFVLEALYVVQREEREEMVSLVKDWANSQYLYLIILALNNVPQSKREDMVRLMHEMKSNNSAVIEELNKVPQEERQEIVQLTKKFELYGDDIVHFIHRLHKVSQGERAEVVALTKELNPSNDVWRVIAALRKVPQEKRSHIVNDVMEKGYGQKGHNIATMIVTDYMWD